MGGYADFTMSTPGASQVAGVCHGGNAGLPPQWLVYISVEDLDQSAARCVELGGQVLAGPSGMGGSGRFCVIKDPAGAVAALFQPA
jgi:predicted enzyme related to lactoylglutathione lyase